MSGAAHWTACGYQAGRDDVQSEFARLRKLTQNQPAQHSRLDKLQQLIDDKRSLLAEAIKLSREDAGSEEARDVVMAGRGIALMDDIRAVVREMLQEEQRLLVEREAAAKSRATVSERFIVTGYLLTLALLVFSGGVAHIDRKKRDEADAHLRVSRAEMSAVIDSAQDGIVTFGEDFRIRLMNPAAAAMHACDVEWAVGGDIASSGLRRPGAEGGRLADVDGFLPKPYSDEQLLSIVRSVLDSSVTQHQKGN